MSRRRVTTISAAAVHWHFNDISSTARNSSFSAHRSRGRQSHVSREIISILAGGPSNRSSVALGGPRWSTSRSVRPSRSAQPDRRPVEVEQWTAQTDRHMCELTGHSSSMGIDRTTANGPDWTGTGHETRTDWYPCRIHRCTIRHGRWIDVRLDVWTYYRWFCWSALLRRVSGRFGGSINGSMLDGFRGSRCGDWVTAAVVLREPSCYTVHVTWYCSCWSEHCTQFAALTRVWLQQSRVNSSLIYLYCLFCYIQRQGERERERERAKGQRTNQLYLRNS